ncbi:MAG: hypothetical protein SFT90_05930 [Rickettsiales bacterium]|nr:hypothetical protein [Rickettsiales bacterium]
MLKWLIVITLFLSGFWLFYKNNLPEFILDSKLADVVNTIMFPLEVKLDRDFPEARNNKNKPKIYQLNYEQIINFRADTEGLSRQTIYYFYNPASISDRLLLTSLNRLMKSHPSSKYDIDYLFVAVSDEPQNLMELLKQTSQINFIPYYITRNDFSPVLMMFTRLGLSHSTELPRLIFKGLSQNDYTEIQAGFFTKGRFEVLIEQKL